MNAFCRLNNQPPYFNKKKRFYSIFIGFSIPFWNHGIGKCGHIMDIAEQNPEANRKITVEDLNIDILPIIYEIIRGIEKDHHDNTVKTRESQDCSLRVLELQKRLDQIRVDIRQLPGIEFSKEQQLVNLESLKTQLKLKQELLQKYRYLAFEINKP